MILFRKHLKIASLKCECSSKEIFYKLISMEEIEKVHLDVSSKSVTIYSQKKISLDKIKYEMQDSKIMEMD